MATYRIDFIDARSGRAVRVADIEAGDDGEAIRLAAMQDSSESMELWCGARKICRFEARASPVPRPLS